MTEEPVPPPGAPDDGTGLPINRKVLLSVVFGTVAFACTFLAPIGGLLLAFPAITTAIHGRREIRGSGGTESGDLLGVAGLTIGITTIGLAMLAAVLSVTTR
ncbi:hypothetical protein [Aeromicrobium sp.]|uniref:hypothetical protein n=1 Tax=Aeromicrobium sp. TaxID=1871063 RepID=UPI0030BCFDE5